MYNAIKNIFIQSPVHVSLTEIFLSLASPKVVLPVAAPVVRALPRFKLWCSALGIPPIYTALTRNSIVLVNRTGTASILLYKEGNYSCVASSNYGRDVKKMSVIFTGKTLICWTGRKYLFLGVK